MKLLIFGAGGQLGKELVRACHSHGIAFHAAEKAEVDIANAEQVYTSIAKHNPAVIVNAAAFTKVDLAETEQELAFKVNRDGATVLAEAAAASNLPLVHVSTDYVFSGGQDRAYSEDDLPAPVNVYGASKLAGEEAVRTILLKHVILRTGWVYGEYGRNFLKTVLGLAATRDKLTIVADQYGTPTTTMDLAAAILRVCLATVEQEAIWGTYHLGGSSVASWYQFAQKIVDAQRPYTNFDPLVIPIASSQYQVAAQRPKRSVLDSGRFDRKFGFRALGWELATEKVVSALLRK